MGLDWTSGFLGAVSGGSDAVVKLSDERRKELAEQLKREALEGIAVRSDQRKFAHDEKLQDEKLAAESEMGQRSLDAEYNLSQEKTRSSEKIASERNNLLRELSKAELKMKERLLTQDKKSTEAAMLNAKIKAYGEARRVGENGGTTEEMNAILETAGLPPLEEFVVEKGTPGFLGFGKTEDVIGRRTAMAPSTEAQAEEPKSDRAAFLESILKGTDQNERPMSDEPPKENKQESEPPQEKPGLLDQEPINSDLESKYKKIWVDESGVIWGVNSAGQTERIMYEPPKMKYEYGKKIPNPEYQKYMDLLKKHGAEK